MLKQTLTEAEHKHISNPFLHRRFVHRRSDLILGGLVILSGGGWFVAPAFAWMAPVRDWFLYFELAGAAFILVKDFVPCKCGRNPVLTRQQRIDILKNNVARSVARDIFRFLFLVLFGLALGVILAAIVVLLFKGLLPVLGGPATVFLICSPILAIGFLALGCGILDKELPWIKDVSRQEFEETANLCDDNEETLNKLIAFSVKIGEFSAADAYSQKLLKLVEESKPKFC